MGEQEEGGKNQQKTNNNKKTPSENKTKQKTIQNLPHKNPNSLSHTFPPTKPNRKKIQREFSPEKAQLN